MDKRENVRDIGIGGRLLRCSLEPAKRICSISYSLSSSAGTHHYRTPFPPAAGECYSSFSTKYMRPPPSSPQQLSHQIYPCDESIFFTPQILCLSARWLAMFHPPPKFTRNLVSPFNFDLRSRPLSDFSFYPFLL